MAMEKPAEEAVEPGAGGFAILDDQGRVQLPEIVREALDLHPGSAVACILTDGAIILIPQDRELVDLMERAPRALEAAGLTVQDLLDHLPKVREEVMIEAYGEEYVRDLERRHAALLGRELPQGRAAHQ